MKVAAGQPVPDISNSVSLGVFTSVEFTPMARVTAKGEKPIYARL